MVATKKRDGPPQIDPDEEVTFAQLAQMVPGRRNHRIPASKETVRQWAERGLLGVKLRARVYLLNNLTTYGDYLRFCEEVEAERLRRRRARLDAARDAMNSEGNSRQRRARKRLERQGAR